MLPNLGLQPLLSECMWSRCKEQDRRMPFGQQSSKNMRRSESRPYNDIESRWICRSACLQTHSTVEAEWTEILAVQWEVHIWPRERKRFAVGALSVCSLLVTDSGMFWTDRPHERFLKSIAEVEDTLIWREEFDYSIWSDLPGRNLLLQTLRRRCSKQGSSSRVDRFQVSMRLFASTAPYGKRYLTSNSLSDGRRVEANFLSPFRIHLSRLFSSGRTLHRQVFAFDLTPGISKSWRLRNKRSGTRLFS